MSKKRTGHKTTRKLASEIPQASAADLKRLRVAMAGNIDTGEIPERHEFRRLERDARGKLPPRKSTMEKQAKT
jgi:hypothetical protein